MFQLDPSIAVLFYVSSAQVYTMVNLFYYGTTATNTTIITTVATSEVKIFL